jgi:hypothetical protein
MLYQEKIMKFLDNWEQSELDLKEEKIHRKSSN